MVTLAASRTRALPRLQPCTVLILISLFADRFLNYTQPCQAQQPCRRQGSSS